MTNSSHVTYLCQFLTKVRNRYLARHLTLHIFEIYQHICYDKTSFSFNRLIPHNSEEMAFFSDQFLRDVLFFAVGGVSSVAILKIWENRESLLREIRRRFDSNETRQPEEHDERFDWEGKSSVSYENILSKSDRIIVISEKLNDTRSDFFDSDTEKVL